ncbi:glycosyltransferase family 2 protein [Paenibacillus sp. 276b]|uniref:glycosyltransferase family 2 protein n=1 Tax=Paenibacillus sp. 276b TaxID=1566277 RepID=UPI0008991620|nr:glycosyltransferase family 2 protein [Paenibacillus sp. 276b]SEB28297.1 Glycosyltransferase involved in cell wall bisynthesis [Paenibacillus sp. 276b]
MKQPKVLIMMSTYNGERYIKEQMDSLIAQVQVETQIYIRDDGSTDSTIEKLRPYVEAYPDRIHFRSEDNLGVIRSFFELIRSSPPTFDYYAFCDQDDVWEQDKLIRAVTLLKTKSSAIPLLYCSSTQMVDQHLNALGVWPKVPQKPLELHNALVENSCVGCTMVMNDITFNQVRSNLPSELSKVIMHDWWIFLYVTIFGEVIFDEQPGIQYRQHEGNVLGGGRDGWIQKWRKRVNRFVNGNNHYILSKQAKLFLDMYKYSLTHAQIEEIRNLLHCLEKNVIDRIWYAFKTPFYRQSLLDNIVLKLVIIAGKL